MPAFEGVSGRSFLCLVLQDGGRRMDSSALPFRIQLCFISCGFSVVLCHE